MRRFLTHLDPFYLTFLECFASVGAISEKSFWKNQYYFFLKSNRKIWNFFMNLSFLDLDLITLYNVNMGTAPSTHWINPDLGPRGTTE